MKILVSSINFAPDHSGIGVYSTDFPIYLAECGDDVTMVTGFPYYPAWKKRIEDHGRLFSKEKWHGIQVLRGWLYVPRRVNTLKRLFHEFTFCFFAFMNFARAGRHDVVVVFSPPFLLGWVGKFFSLLWCCPLVINVQDLPLDAAASLGMVRRGWFSKVVSACELWIYKSADSVVSISQGMIAVLSSKGICSKKLALVPNWIDVQGVSRVSKGQFRACHLEAQGKFIVAYAGNLGMKQGVDSLLHLAKTMAQDSRFFFFLIGDGADKPRLLSIAEELKLQNTMFLPLLPREEYLPMLEDVDIVFVGQRRGAGNNFFPSKLLGVMAQGKPLLVAADLDSELAQSLAKWGCGLVASPEDIPLLSSHLKHLAGDFVLRESLGSNARKVVSDFDRGKVLDKWRTQICQLAN